MWITFGYHIGMLLFHFSSRLFLLGLPDLKKDKSLELIFCLFLPALWCPHYLCRLLFTEWNNWYGFLYCCSQSSETLSFLIIHFDDGISIFLAHHSCIYSVLLLKLHWNSTLIILWRCVIIIPLLHEILKAYLRVNSISHSCYIVATVLIVFSELRKICKIFHQHILSILLLKETRESFLAHCILIIWIEWILICFLLFLQCSQLESKNLCDIFSCRKYLKEYQKQW